MDHIEKTIPDQTITFNLVGYSLGGAFSLNLNQIEDRMNFGGAYVLRLSQPYTEIKDFDSSIDTQ